MRVAASARNLGRGRVAGASGSAGGVYKGQIPTCQNFAAGAEFGAYEPGYANQTRPEPSNLQSTGPLAANFKLFVARANLRRRQDRSEGVAGLLGDPSCGPRAPPPRFLDFSTQKI